MSDLFSHLKTENLPGTPLAERLRPSSLDSMVGQAELLGAGGMVRQFIRSGRLPNLLLWGPPGTGKTTFARSLAGEVKAEFLSLHAVDIGARELRQVGEEAQERRRLYATQTLVFVDEIHRLNKAQQDVLLPYMERGDFVLIGATTENPSYELNRAVLSRSYLLIFGRLSDEALGTLAERAFEHLGLKQADLFGEGVLTALISGADGDARRFLNALDLISGLYQASQETSSPNSAENLQFPLSSDAAQSLLPELGVGYDKKSEQHYDVISAFIKSIRGSDPDAGLYYLARMLDGGEDPLFIARRLVILASEDVGNADPRALSVAVAGAQAVEMVGLPEAAINLAQVVTYLASAPKSNRSYLGLNKARDLVRKTGTVEVPKALRSAKGAEMKRQGWGQGYRYPHDHPRAWVAQTYLPEELKESRFYEPSEQGFEKSIREYRQWLKQDQKGR